MRVKTGYVRRRGHKRILERTRGMRMTKGRLIKVSIEADLHKGQYEYVGRRKRKRDLRRLWITRLSAALRAQDQPLTYSKFISLLKSSQVELDRKVLADLAVADPATFSFIVTKVGEKGN